MQGVCELLLKGLRQAALAPWRPGDVLGRGPGQQSSTSCCFDGELAFRAGLGGFRSGDPAGSEMKLWLNILFRLQWEVDLRHCT